MALNRFQPILIAGLLPLLIFTWFTPTITGQIDFWLLWLLAMTLVGLPLIFAEIGLAHRSGTTPLIALPKLTREADISTTWRGFGWLTIILLMIVNGHLLLSSTKLLTSFFVQIETLVILSVLFLAVIGLSFLKQLSGWLAFALALVSVVINLMQSFNNIQWQMTAMSLTEWSIAVVMALVCVGVGTGLFWHARANQLLESAEQPKKNQLIASHAVLPIWGVQIVTGGLMAMTITLKSSDLTNLIYAMAMLCGAGYLLYLTTSQVSLRWKQQPFNFLVLVLVALVSVMLAATMPISWLNHLLVIFSLVTAIWLAIFAGWQMKISHVRKSLNFQSEAIYNIWRVAVRIAVPLAILLAVIGWVLSWF